MKRSFLTKERKISMVTRIKNKPEKLKKWIAMAKAGESLDDISLALGLNRQSILEFGSSQGHSYWDLSGKVPKNRPKNKISIPLQKRMCLVCTKKFNSWGAGNRICPPCKKNNDPDFAGTQITI